MTSTPTEEDLRLSGRLARSLGFEADGECGCREYPECKCRRTFAVAQQRIAAFRAEARREGYAQRNEATEAACRIAEGMYKHAKEDLKSEREASERIVAECEIFSEPYKAEILRRLRERAK